MARCSHLCIGRQLVKVIDLDAEMESDSETNYILVVDNPDSPKDADNVKHVNKGPVFSLECLHDNDEEIGLSTDSHVDTDASPELVMNCDDDSEDSESSESSSADELDVIDIDEVPELIISSGEDNSQEPTSSSTDNTSSMNDKSMDTADVPALIRNSSEQSVLKHPNLNAEQNVSSNVPQISWTRPSPSVPTRNGFEGKYFFRIAIHHPEHLMTSEGLVYCESKNKLYISKDHPFKVLVSADSLNVPFGSIVRVIAAYSNAEHSYKAVRRCPHHEQQDHKTGNSAYKHVVQSLSESAIYEESKDGILSVSVPYETPQVGELYTSYIFKLTDYTSCPGGMNRRPIMLIFTLEKEGVVMGKQTLEARICAAPLRDYKNEKIKLEKNNGYSIKDISPKQVALQSRETFPHYYTITVKDPQLYQFLEQMKVLYESSVTAEIVSKSAQIMQRCPKLLKDS